MKHSDASWKRPKERATVRRRLAPRRRRNRASCGRAGTEPLRRIIQLQTIDKKLTDYRCKYPTLAARTKTPRRWGTLFDGAPASVISAFDSILLGDINHNERDIVLLDHGRWLPLANLGEQFSAMLRARPWSGFRTRRVGNRLILMKSSDTSWKRPEEWATVRVRIAPSAKTM